MTKQLSRRHFVGGLAEAVATLALSRCYGWDAWASVTPASVPAPTPKAPALPGRLIGVTTKRVPKAVLGIDVSGWHSAIISLDLMTGAIAYLPLAGFKDGHSLIGLPHGLTYCTTYGAEKDHGIFLDAKLQVVGAVELPEGMAFGGHSVLLPDGKTIVAPVNSTSEKRTASDTGMMALIDVKTKVVSRTINIPVLHGHDIILTRDAAHVVIADDGDVPQSGGTLQYNPFDPAFYFFNSSNLKLERKIKLPINGSVVHIDQGIDGKIYGGVEQLVENNAEGINVLRKDFGDQTDAVVSAAVERYRLRHRTLLGDDEIDTGSPEQLVVPGPLVVCNPKTSKVHTIMIEKSKQLAAFETVTNDKTGNVLCCWAESNHILKIDGTSGEASLWDTKAYGIDQPMGLLDIPGLPLMAVNGLKHGIVLIDTRTMAEHTRFDVETFGLKHMILAA